MKKSVSISISEDVWEGVKEAAWRQKKSASQYLEDLVAAGFKRTDVPGKKKCSPQEQLDIDRNAKDTPKKEKIKKVRAEAISDSFQVPFNPQPKK